MDLKTLIFKLCAIFSVSGFEKRGTAELVSLVGDRLEFLGTDRVGNHLLRKRCTKKDAPKILIDTHFDEIGMIVTDITDDGFLRVAPLGGIDSSILQAADVLIYGKETLRGVVCSTPPHLKKSDKLPKPEEVLIDTGLSAKQVRSLIDVGTPVGFAPVYGELLNGRLAGKSFDDKACAACALWALMNTPSEALAGDVYVLLSSFEETSRLGGASSAVFSVAPDYAMVIDVNLARVPDTKDFETVEMGKGISISVSAATHTELTKAVRRLCEEREIAHSVIAAPSSTGTNAPSVNLTLDGIPVVDVGLPLASMHTYNEVIDMEDCNALVRLVKEFVCSENIAEQMSTGGMEWL